MDKLDSPSPVPIFAGGIALGAYQGGAFARLSQRGIAPAWIAGSSIGAVNGAVIAGSAPQDRIAHLQALWLGAPAMPFAPHAAIPGALRHAANWATAIGTRLMGAPGQFHPRVSNPFSAFRSLYDLEPLRQRLSALVDFERLNGGELRFTAAATDLAAGELVLFDTHRGDRIGMDHLLASCGFLPEFAPVAVDGRLLGDGGLAANAPIEALLHDPPAGGMTVFVVDLFPRDGDPPVSLEHAILRKNDLTFACQTSQRLEAYAREQRLEARLATLEGRAHAAPAVLHLSYRPDAGDAISDKTYDYSPRMLERRWQAGESDMDEALAHVADAGRAAPKPFAVRRHARVRSPQ